MDAKKILIIGGVAAVSITVIVGLTIWLILPSCQLIENEPVLELYKMTRVESKDRTALVDFEGYLKISSQASKKVFLPLYAKSLEVYAEDAQREVTINTDCAKIIVKILPTDNNPTYSLKKITVIFSDENGAHKTCSTEPLEIYYNKTTHYSCHRLRTYSCRIRNSEEGDASEIAKINLGLEIEAYRDPEQAISGQYSTPAKNCIDDSID